MDAPRDGVHSFPASLRGRRDLGELDGWRGIGLVRLATAQDEAECQQDFFSQQHSQKQSELQAAPEVGRTRKAGAVGRRGVRAVRAVEFRQLSSDTHGCPLAVGCSGEEDIILP
jgi:hypothetical protein